MIEEEVTYQVAGCQMRGHFVGPSGNGSHPAVLLVHGAHGLDEFILDRARKLATHGMAVLAADLWGDRQQLRTPVEIAGRLSEFAEHRDMWMARIAAAHEALARHMQVPATTVGALGYCFGGTTVLEYIRTRGNLGAAVSFHAGLDLVLSDWPVEVATPLLLCSGASDRMATSSDLARLTHAMSVGGLRWEVNLYGGVKHGFTEPDVPGRPPFAAYDPSADHRSWQAMLDFFGSNLN